MAKYKYKGVTYKLSNVVLYRNGKWAPQWMPAPALRRAGWKRISFMDENGNWLTGQKFLTAAQSRIAAVDAWRYGDTIPSDTNMDAINPDIPAPQSPPDSFNYLFQNWQNSLKFKQKRSKTQDGYRYSIRALLPILGDDSIYEFRSSDAVRLYEKLCAVKSLSVARAHMTVLHTALEHARKQGWIEINPAARLEMENDAVRVRFWEPAELIAIMQVAQKMGRPSIGYAVLAGANFGQRLADTLDFRITIATETHYTFRQNKSRRHNRPGKRITFPQALLDDNRDLLNQAADHAKSVVGATPTHIFINEESGRPYTTSNFNKWFNRIKGEAIKIEPRLAGDDDGLDARYQDLRDTALTRMRLANLSMTEICAILGHSESSALDVWKHYLYMHPDFAQSGAEKLAEWKAANNIIY